MTLFYPAIPLDGTTYPNFRSFIPTFGSAEMKWADTFPLKASFALILNPLPN